MWAENRTDNEPERLCLQAAIRTRGNSNYIIAEFVGPAQLCSKRKPSEFLVHKYVVPSAMVR
jgi:hypothetical protein